MSGRALRSSSLAVLVTAHLLVACSEGAGGGTDGAGGREDGSGGGPREDITIATSSAASAGSGGGAGVPPEQSFASNRLFALLQGEADNSDVDEPGCVGRRMVGCALDAPELGSRVVYLERSALETPDLPDRQLVVSLRGVDELRENELQWTYAAQAHVLLPTDGSLWIGLCDGEGPAAPPGQLATSDACGLQGSVSDTSMASTLSADNIDPACLGIATDAVLVTTVISVDVPQNAWADFFSYADGSYDADPPCEGGGGCRTDVCPMTRRTPVPPIPEGDG